jgi:hypothetical protein
MHQCSSRSRAQHTVAALRNSGHLASTPNAVVDRKPFPDDVKNDTSNTVLGQRRFALYNVGCVQVAPLHKLSRTSIHKHTK